MDDRDKYVKELLDSRDYRLSNYHLDSEWSIATLSVELISNYGMDGVDYNLTPTEIQEFRQALTADLETLSYDVLYDYSIYESDKPTLYLTIDMITEKTFGGRSWAYRPMLSIRDKLPRAYAVLERIDAAVKAEYAEADIINDPSTELPATEAVPEPS